MTVRRSVKKNRKLESNFGTEVKGQERQQHRKTIKFSDRQNSSTNKKKLCIDD